MVADWEFDVLDYPKDSLRTDCKDFFRVHVAPGILKTFGLEKGDPCNLNLSGTSVGIVLVWEPNKSSRTRDLQIPKHLQSLYGVAYRAKVTLSKIHYQLPPAFNVILQEVSPNGVKNPLPSLGREECSHWAWLLEDNLYRAENISPGMVIDGLEAKHQKRSFKIVRVNDSLRVSPHRFQQSCKIEIIGDEELSAIDVIDGNQPTLTIPIGGVGGLEIPIKELNEEFATFGSTVNGMHMPSSIPEWTNGIIIYGSSGTGKTLLLRKIREAGWRGVFDLGAELSKAPNATGKALGSIHDIFADAKTSQPSIILVDGLDNFVTESSQSSAQAFVLIEALSQEIENLSSFRTLVVATTRSLAKISSKLRTAHVFSLEVEVPVPNLRSRASILKALCDLPSSADNVRLDAVASRTHGFVGADLAMLICVASREARKRLKTLMYDGAHNANKSIFSLDKIEDEDIDFALRKVKPTAIREIFVEIQETRWTDIGGQEEVKEVLRQALSWPSKYGEDFEAQGIIASKGLLLYGPPGCSKTMTARAAATESGYNFIAVKGAELLNMYVGESERKIRDIFSLARAVRPSILFFDEIDALGTSRNEGQLSGLNIVTTLLNELDGVVGLTGVFVLAATNRPDLIDAALIRAGRLDKLLYVGPPDLNARRHILSMRVQRMRISEGVDVELLAQLTEGFSGAELINICKDAALAAIKDLDVGSTDGTRKTSIVGQKHFEGALSGVRKVITTTMLDFFEDFRSNHLTRH